MPETDQSYRARTRHPGKSKEAEIAIDDEDTPEGYEDESSRRSVRLAVNVSAETARIFRSLIERKGISITEGIRRAIVVWRFVEDETERGNKLIVQESDGTQREVLLL